MIPMILVLCLLVGTDSNLQIVQLLLESNPNMPIFMDKYAHATLPYAAKAAGILVYCVGVDSGGAAQHVLEVNFFMIMYFYIKSFKPC